MISAVECREHAVECRQMSERAPTLRVRDILIDMARAWERLALETEHNAPAIQTGVAPSISSWVLGRQEKTFA
jgi:hypothetical protein